MVPNSGATSGDGILAYFCYPVANENDPERAVRAAVEIVQGIGGLKTPAKQPLQARLGIATGRVVVSDLAAGGLEEKQGVTGSIPNEAARLQSLAGPNGIVVNEQTYARIASRFLCEPLGSLEVRGFERPLHPARVIGERPADSRPGTLTQRHHLTGFYGRDADIEVLRAGWRRVEVGEGRVILVTGEPGIGKSRLVEQMTRSELPPGTVTVRLGASPFTQDTPLAPIAEYARTRAGLDLTDTPEAALAKLETILRGSTQKRRDAALVLSRLLGIAVDEPMIVGETPDQLKLRTVAALTAQVLALAEDGPACLVVEDLHWLDPTSRDLLRQLAVRAGSHRLLILLTVLSDDLSGAEAETAIPASLQESLAARLDRSGPAKQLAQVAAVIGRLVPYELLARVSGMGRFELEELLSTLVESGILERHTTAGRDRYNFSHALVRDASYASLLRERRKELHARVARAIETAADGTALRNPEILARHLTEADLAEDAAPYWMEAARRSLTRSALTEAMRMLRRGLDALERLPETEDILKLRLQMSALLGPALIGLKGAGAPETRNLYNSAHEMALRLPEDPSHFPLHWGWWRLSADGRDNLVRSSELLRLATKLGDPSSLLQAHHCCWASHLQAGSFNRFCEHVETGLAIYDQGNFTKQAELYGNHDAKVCALGGASQVYWMQGRLRDALRADEEARAWAAHVDHLGSRVHAMGLTLLHHVYRRDYTEVFARSGELIRTTSEYGMADHGAAGLIFGGWVLGMQDDPETGLKRLEEGFDRQRDVVTTEDFPVYLCALAEVLIRQGNADMAAERIERELPEFERIGLKVWIPELLRVLAEAILIADPTSVDRAAKLLSDAELMATQQQVPMLLLRIAMSRAHINLRSDERTLPSRRLRAALDLLPEGEISDEIIQAQQLAGGTRTDPAE